MGKSSPERGGGPPPEAGVEGRVGAADRRAGVPLHHASHGPRPRAGEDLLAAVRVAASRFAFSATPRLDAELLLAHALGIPRERLLLTLDDHAVPPTFAALVDRRAAHEPVAYIIGTRAFWTIDLRVGPGVLVPRADSETLIEAAVEHFRGTPGPRTILDLGTGPGTLLLAALAQWPEADGLGIDASGRALDYAQINAADLGMATRARFEVGNWLFGRRGWFDLILCNPPYVAADAALPTEVSAFEPAEALHAGADGLDAYRILAPQVACALGGVACIEIGHDQGERAAALFRAEELAVAPRRDLGGRDRCLVVTRGSSHLEPLPRGNDISL